MHLGASELKTVSLENTHLKAEYLKDKLNILDVKAELSNGKIIDIEIQVEPFPEMRSRVTYYESKLITEQIGEGCNYSELKPAISIIIVNYPLITESKKCHTRFRMLETEEGFLFNDLQEINVLDLTKIATEKDTDLLNWLQFLKSEKEADFMALAAKNPIIKQAYDTLKVISADKNARYMYESRLKGERDQYAREHAAEARGEARGETRSKISIARTMRIKGIPSAVIAEITNLSGAEIEAL
ncbi:hypothetical protein AGMMS49938_02290 [Fibrobacterales bacterium]|nr:hypothetical protein AGMMS49938_02290 [Fibrobacterales bacterium]